LASTAGQQTTTLSLVRSHLNQPSFSKVTDTPEGFWERAEIGGGAADSEGNQVKDGGTM